jgi:hypothetical protein
MLGPPEVVPVLRFGQPAPLARSFTRHPAPLFAAILLAPNRTVVWHKKILATSTLPLPKTLHPSHLQPISARIHNCQLLLREQTKNCIPETSGTTTGTKGFLIYFEQENSGTRVVLLCTFKPPGFVYFQNAADKCSHTN